MESGQQQRAGTELQDLTNEIEQGIQRGLYTWKEIQDAVMAKTRETVAETDEYVHENPWKVVCWAGGLGFVLGLLVAPRSDE